MTDIEAARVTTAANDRADDMAPARGIGFAIIVAAAFWAAVFLIGAASL